MSNSDINKLVFIMQTACLLRGSNWILKCSSDDFDAWEVQIGKSGTQIEFNLSILSEKASEEAL